MAGGRQSTDVRPHDLEGADQVGVDDHDGPFVVELAGVIRHGKNSDQLLVREKLKPVFNYLVGPTDQIDVVSSEELGDHVGPKNVRNSPVVFLPAVHGGVGVRPEQVAHQAGFRDFAGADNLVDLVEPAELGAEPSVHAENLFVDDGSDGEAVEEVPEGFPELDAEPAPALVVKTVDAVHDVRLVVASEEEEIEGIFDFVSQEKANGLEALGSAVDIIAEK